MRVRVNGRWFTEHAQWRADLPGWRVGEREKEKRCKKELISISERVIRKWRVQRGHKIGGRSQKNDVRASRNVLRGGKTGSQRPWPQKREIYMRERKVNTLFPHWPGRYSTLTLFWIRRVYQGCWSEGSRRRRAAVGSEGQDRESDKDKTRQGKTHYSPTAKETKLFL